MVFEPVTTTNAK